jgi:tetratricopeptide (TPR) repeat protein
LQDKASLSLDAVLMELARRISLALELTPFGKWPAEPAFREYFKQVYIPKIFDALPDGHSIVLLFDEFDVLDSPESNLAAVELFPYLRDMLAYNPAKLQFVFVIGRNLDDLTNRALPLLKGLSVHRVSLLRKADTNALIRLSENGETLFWTDEAIEKVWEWTNGHPYLTQQLCWVTWESAYEDDPETAPTITPDDVDAAVEDTLEYSLAALEWLWDGLGPAERVVASALAQAGPGSISLEELETVLRDSGVRVLIGELQNAPETLEKWDLLEKNIGSYRFRVELLRRWLLMRKPLSQVQDELDRIQPVAENLFQAANGLYSGGNFRSAADLLRQALGINPNHFKASRLLAEILIANGEYEEAIHVLRNLCDFQPNIAKPRLIQALLAKADTIPKEDYDDFEEVVQMEVGTHEPFSLYQEVLTLDSQNKQAKLGLVGFWELRGDGLSRLQNPNQAVDSYRKAIDYLEVQEGATLTEHWKTLMLKLGEAYHALAKLLESEKAYTQSLGVFHTLQKEFGILDKDWEDDIDRLVRKSQLDVTYNRAIKAMVNDEVDKAIDLLQEVINLEPSYMRAAHYLNELVEKGTVHIDEDLEESTGTYQRVIVSPPWLQFFEKLADNGTLTWPPFLMVTLGLGIEILVGARFGAFHPYLYAFTPILLLGWVLTAVFGQRTGIKPFLRSVGITFTGMFIIGTVFATSIIPIAESLLQPPDGELLFHHNLDIIVFWAMLAILLATSFVNLLSTQSYNVAKGVVTGVSSGLIAPIATVMLMFNNDMWTWWMVGLLFIGLMNTAFGSSNLKDDRNGFFALLIQAVLMLVGVIAIYGYFWGQLPNIEAFYIFVPVLLTILMLLKGASMRRRMSLKTIGIFFTVIGFAATFWMIFLRGWEVMRDLPINY